MNIEINPLEKLLQEELLRAIRCTCFLNLSDNGLTIFLSWIKDMPSTWTMRKLCVSIIYVCNARMLVLYLTHQHLWRCGLFFFFFGSWSKVHLHTSMFYFPCYLVWLRKTKIQYFKNSKFAAFNIFCRNNSKNTIILTFTKHFFTVRYRTSCSPCGVNCTTHRWVINMLAGYQSHIPGYYFFF